MQVQRALDQLGDHVLRGVEDVLVGGRAPYGWRVLVHGRSHSAAPGRRCQADFSPRCSGSRSTSLAISLVQAETQGMRERSTR